MGDEMVPVEQVKPFERWPGYDEQSWAERFAELDRRYQMRFASRSKPLRSLAAQEERDDG